MLKRRIRFQAAVLLVVAVWFSVMFIPLANANVVPFPGAAARLLIRTVGYGALVTTSPGAFVLYVAGAAVTGYLVYKLSATSAVKTAIDNSFVEYPPPSFYDLGQTHALGDYTASLYMYAYGPGVNRNYRIRVAPTGMSHPNQYTYSIDQQSPAGQGSYGGIGVWYASTPALAWAGVVSNLNSYTGSNWRWGHQGDATPNNDPPDTPNPNPYDPGIWPWEEVQYPTGSVYMSPGLAANLTGAEGASVVAGPVSDAVAQDFIDSAKLVEVDPNDGATGTAPTASEVELLTALNALLSDSKLQSRETTQQQVLQKLGEIDTALDNASGGSFPQEAQDALDEIAASNDNIAVGIDSLTDAVTQTSADQTSLATRWAEVRDLAAVKFPFSIAGAWSISAPSNPGNYEFTSLVLAGHTIPVNPMNTPISTWITWARQLLVYMFWIMTGGAILKKALEM